MKSESFRAAASRVIDEGSRERRAAAQRLASQFKTGADEFDLRSLERLGEDGLAAFLSNLGHQNPFSNQRQRELTPHAQLSAGSEPAKDSGWASLRSREPRWFVRAVVRGWAVGFGLVVIGSILLKIVE
jgi:hypothetical protein